MFNRIIVICTGNICRSPMAEALLKAKLADPKRVIVSAGIGALVGHPADPIAQELMREQGLDISGHRAQQATVQLLSSMDLILTLDQTHGQWIAARFPFLRGRTHKLLKWDGDKDIVDPYRLARHVFEQSRVDIELGVRSWAERL